MEKKGIVIPNQESFHFRLPSIVAVVGSTGSGKSQLVGRILRDRRQLIRPAPMHVIYVYNIYQRELFDKIRDWCGGDENITFVQGIGELQKMTIRPRTCLVLDDQQQSLADSKEFGIQLMTVGMHHTEMIVFFVCQSLYLKSKYNTTIQRQSSAVIIFQNRRNMYEAESLLRQTLQLKPHEVRSLFKHAAQYNPRPYLCIDCAPETPEHRRLTTNILADDSPHVFYYIDDSNE